MARVEMPSVKEEEPGLQPSSAERGRALQWKEREEKEEEESARDVGKMEEKRGVEESAARTPQLKRERKSEGRGKRGGREVQPSRNPVGRAAGLLRGESRRTRHPG